MDFPPFVSVADGCHVWKLFFLRDLSANNETGRDVALLNTNVKCAVLFIFVGVQGKSGDLVRLYA